MADYHMSHTGADLDLAISRVISDYKDTSDATAQASNIQSGFTAYAGGAKITGTHVCSSSPTVVSGSKTTSSPASHTFTISNVTARPTVSASIYMSAATARSVTNNGILCVTASGSGTSATCLYYVGNGSVASESCTATYDATAKTYTITSTNRYFAASATYSYRLVG